jgi:hypothetical protein
LVACCGQQTRGLSISCHVSLSTIVIISWPMNEPPPIYIIYDIAEDTPKFYLFEDKWCQFQQNQNQHEKNECNHYKLTSISQKCRPIVLIMNDMTINYHNSSLTSSTPTTVCC